MTASLKPLVALYKAYRGGEWFGASLESVRPHCVGAVVVSSDAPWADAGPGPHPPEDCRAPLGEFLARRPDFPVTLARPPGRPNTTAQYATGLSLVKWLYGGEVGVLIVDTDEVWADADLAALRRAMADGRGGLAFRAGVRTYLKSPLYRVTPQEPARVVVGLANPRLPTGHSRFADLPRHYAKAQIRDVDGCTMHHFGYVRADPAEIARKLVNTSTQDRTPQRPDWVRQVWDRLPAGRDLHPTPRCERLWAAVEAVGAGQLPPAALGETWLWNLPGVTESLTADDAAWRRQLEGLAPGQCPATTVGGIDGAGLARVLRAAVGADVEPALLDFLLPKFRMSLTETLQLAWLVAELPPQSRAVEVGSGKGGSMATLVLTAGPGFALTAVDPYQPYDEQNVNFDRGVTEGSDAEFREVLNQVLLDRHVSPGTTVELVRKPSLAAVSAVPDASLGLVLVDGNHSYEHCLADLNAWWPKVKAGGVVLAHDHAPRFPGVIKAVREFERERGVRFSLPAGSTLAWLRKG